MEVRFRRLVVNTDYKMSKVYSILMTFFVNFLKPDRYQPIELF